MRTLTRVPQNIIDAAPTTINGPDKAFADSDVIPQKDPEEEEPEEDVEEDGDEEG